MNGAIIALGTLLQIKPLLKMLQREANAERVRTRQAAMRRLKELLAQYAPYEKVALLHSNAKSGPRPCWKRCATCCREMRSGCKRSIPCWVRTSVRGSRFRLHINEQIGRERMSFIEATALRCWSSWH